MTRSINKRARLTVQPRLTAFLQPTLVPPNLQTTPCPLGAAEAGIKGASRSNERSKVCGPTANAGAAELDRGAALSGPSRQSYGARVCLQEDSSDKQVSGSVLWEIEAPSDAGGRAIGQTPSKADGRWESNCRSSTAAVRDQDNHTDLNLNGFGQFSKQLATRVGMDEQKGRSLSSKCSLEAFVKRRRVEPSRGPERNWKEANAAAGRAVNGSAYAQCPVCTMHIPLTKISHHLDIECVQLCTETSTFHLPNGAQTAVQARLESPAMASNGANIGMEDRRCSPPVVETINKHPQDILTGADVRKDGADVSKDAGDVSERVSKLQWGVDKNSRGREVAAAQLGTGVFEGFLGVESSNGVGHDGRAGRAVSGSGFGANQGFPRRTEVNEKEQPSEDAGEFEVMPTLDAWLAEVNRDSQGPVLSEGGAQLDDQCERGRGPTEALECGRSSLRLAGGKAGNLGDGMPESDSEVVEGGETDCLLELGRTKEAEALCSNYEQRLSELIHNAPRESVLHEQTESRSNKPVVTNNSSLETPVRSSSQLPKGPVSNEPTSSSNQTRNASIHTASPPRKEPVNSLLGMVRERGQRPLFGLSWAAIQMRQPSAPKGHYLVENFLTEEEEAHILASLDADVSNPWLTSRVFGDVNEGKAYGMVTDLRRRTISKPKRPMPAFLQSVLARIRTVAPSLSSFAPNECNAINYRREEGHWLRAHVDDRQLSGTIIAGISLHSDCVMTYERERGRPEKFRVRLPRRCLQVQTQDSRYNYTHSIKNADLLGERRVSITFRQVAEPHS